MDKYTQTRVKGTVLAIYGVVIAAEYDGKHDSDDLLDFQRRMIRSMVVLLAEDMAAPSIEGCLLPDSTLRMNDYMQAQRLLRETGWLSQQPELYKELYSVVDKAADCELKIILQQK